MRDAITVHVGEHLGPVATFHPREEIRRLNRQVRSTFGGQKVEITTHSQVVINHLGLLVSQGKLAPEEVQILRHFKNDLGEACYIHRFTKEGYLEDPWPFGFFNDTDDLDDLMAA